MEITRQNGYSTSVDLYLVIDGTRYSVKRVSESSFELADDALPIEPAGEVTLVVKIDGRATEYPIVITNHIPGERIVQYF